MYVCMYVDRLTDRWSTEHTSTRAENTSRAFSMTRSLFVLVSDASKLELALNKKSVCQQQKISSQIICLYKRSQLVGLIILVLWMIIQSTDHGWWLLKDQSRVTETDRINSRLHREDVFRSKGGASPSMVSVTRNWSFRSHQPWSVLCMIIHSIRTTTRKIPSLCRTGCKSFSRYHRMKQSIVIYSHSFGPY